MEMIESQVVDGRKATVVYLTSGFEPSTPDRADIIKVLFDGGEVAFLPTKKVRLLVPEVEIPARKVRLALLRKAEWNEEDHPRDEDGRFVESVAGGLGSVSDVGTQTAYHHTSEIAASKIVAEGFRDSGNSMYGRGVYLTDKDTGYNQYGDTKLHIELAPHRQLSVADDTDVSRVLRQLTGVDPMFGDTATKLKERGIKSLTTAVDGERYTVVFDKSIIKIKDRTKK